MSERIDSHLASGNRLSPAAKWILAIVGLLGANFAAMVLLITKANDGPSRVVPAYFDRALRYDGASDRGMSNRALGWSTEVACVDGIITVTVTENSGAPLVGARVGVVGNYRSHGQRIARELIAAAPGVYKGRSGGTGWVDLSIAIERGSSRFVREIAVLAQ